MVHLNGTYDVSRLGSTVSLERSETWSMSLSPLVPCVPR